MLEQFNTFIAPYKEKLENLLKIGSITNIKGSNGTLQEIQLKTLRNIEDALKLGQFGLNSKAPLESRCIVAKIGNEKIVIANEHLASIIDVSQGNTILYNENGDYVKVENGTITIKAENVVLDTTNTTINATNTTINSNTSINGTLDVSQVLSASTFSGLSGGNMVSNVDIVSDGISLQDHTHSQGADSDGDTQVETNKPT